MLSVLLHAAGHIFNDVLDKNKWQLALFHTLQFKLVSNTFLMTVFIKCLD